MLGLAWVASERHQFDTSIEWANKVLVLAPKIHAAHGLVGDAYVEMGNYDAAFTSYQAMLDLRPDISSYSRGAHLLYLTGDTRKAVWLMDKAIKSGGPYAENTAWCRAKLANMYLDTGALMPAELMLKQALKTTPDNYHVLATAARAKQMRGDLKAAIALYEKAVAVTPQHDALIALGDLYAATDDTARAEKQFTQVDAAHEHYLKHGVNGELYMARFWADHDRHKERALKIAEAATNVTNPVDADSAAWVFYKNGKNEQAKQRIDQALAIGSPDAERLYHAGMIYAKAGDRSAAQKFLGQALSRNPQFSLRGTPEAVATLKRLGETRTVSASVQGTATDGR
jgi:tetratricopeptide (TPR) repeat protein